MAGMYDKIEAITLGKADDLKDKVLKANELLSSGWSVLDTCPTSEGLQMVFAHIDVQSKRQMPHHYD